MIGLPAFATFLVICLYGCMVYMLTPSADCNGWCCSMHPQPHSSQLQGLAVHWLDIRLHKHSLQHLLHSSIVQHTVHGLYPTLVKLCTPTLRKTKMYMIGLYATGLMPWRPLLPKNTCLNRMQAELNRNTVRCYQRIAYLTYRTAKAA